MCCKIGEFWAQGIKYIVVHHKKTHKYVTHDVTFEVQKTCGWSPTPLWKCTLCNSRFGQRGGQMDHHKY